MAKSQRATPASTSEPSRRPRWLPTNRVLLYSAGVGFVLLWGLPRIVMPLATDQAYFALGARTILDGDQLYRDFWDIKPPLIYLIYALPAALFGEHVEAFRLLDLVNTVAAMFGVFLLTRRLFNERAALFAGGLYGFSYLTTAGFGGLGQNESFMVAPLTLALALYPGPDGGRNQALKAGLSGLLLGVVIAVKFSGAVFVLALPAMELLLQREGRLDLLAAARRLLLAAAGVLAVQAGWIAYLAAAGVLDDFIEVQREYTIPYSNYRYTPVPFSYPRFVLQATADWFRANAFLLVPVWAAFAFSIFRERCQREVLLLSLIGVLGILSVWWQGKFFIYHWLIMLPLMAPLAGWAVDQTWDLVATLGARQRNLAAGLLVLGFAGLASASVLSTWDSYRFLGSFVAGSIDRQELDEEYLLQLKQNHELVDYVRANSGPDEGFYLWGFWTAPYLWAERPVATQFLTSSALRADWSPEEWRRELVADLEAAPPRFFAVAAGDRQPWLTGNSQTSEGYFCEEFPALRDFVDSRYDAVYRNELFVLYERDAAPRDIVTWCDQIEAERRALESQNAAP